VSVAPTDASLNLFAIGIEKKFVVIEPMPFFRCIRPKHSISVQLAGAHLGQITVPNHVGLLGQRDAEGLTFTGDVKEAKLHFLGML
jgi:hypothetical protein